MKHALSLILILVLGFGCISQSKMESYEALQYYTRALIVEDVIKNKSNKPKPNTLVCYNPPHSRCYLVKDIKFKFRKGDVIFLKDNHWIYKHIKICK